MSNICLPFNIIHLLALSFLICPRNSTVLSLKIKSSSSELYLSCSLSSNEKLVLKFAFKFDNIASISFIVVRRCCNILPESTGSKGSALKRPLNSIAVTFNTRWR